MGVRVKGIHVI